MVFLKFLILLVNNFQLSVIIIIIFFFYKNVNNWLCCIIGLRKAWKILRKPKKSWAKIKKWKKKLRYQPNVPNGNNYFTIWTQPKQKFGANMLKQSLATSNEQKFFFTRFCVRVLKGKFVFHLAWKKKGVEACLKRLDNLILLPDSKS